MLSARQRLLLKRPPTARSRDVPMLKAKMGLTRKPRVEFARDPKSDPIRNLAATSKCSRVRPVPSF